MKVVCISDTHMQLGDFEIPDGDVLVHAGDLTGRGKKHEVESQLRILNSLPHRYKIFIAGNHDHFFEDHLSIARNMLRESFPNLVYLQDSFFKVYLPETQESAVFYGAPWTPNFYDWAFMPPRESEELHNKWKKIPEGIDVLITHGPPWGTLDRTRTGWEVGCELLTKELTRIKPKFHVFGHVHESYGIITKEDITYINAAICDRDYFPIHEPITIEV